MLGAFPFMHLLSKALVVPVKKLAGKLGINEISAFGLVSAMATDATTFEMMGKMDDKGVGAVLDKSNSRRDTAPSSSHARIILHSTQTEAFQKAEASCSRRTLFL